MFLELTEPSSQFILATLAADGETLASVLNL